MTGKFRVIGLDPGLRRTGWGVVEAQGTRLFHLGNGVCAPEGADLAQRLAHLHRMLAALISEWRPDAAAVEHTFVNADAVSAMKLAHARAIALLAPASAGIPVAEYAPNAVKKAVVGVGKADKSQVEHMVKILLPGAIPQGADAADALALAICHVYNAGTAARIAALMEKAR